MKRKLWRMSTGCNASGRGRRRSSGQMYRAVTIPQAMKLNAMLPKNQSCDTMNISFLEFQPLAAAGGGDGCVVAVRHCGLGGADDDVLPAPHLGGGRELRLLW